MPSPSDLPYLIRLLDDESETVQRAVSRELAAFGASLENELARLEQPPDAQQRAALDRLLEKHRGAWLEGVWSEWYDLTGEMEQLERALSLLAAFQSGPECHGKVERLLDALAEEFQNTGEPVDARALALARFLFGEKGLRGERNNYYEPLNSNLVHVIEARSGIPVSLACVYMLTGHRLGLRIRGCNWPGHFFARTVLNAGQDNETLLLVDCFNRGHVIDEASFLKMQGPSRQAAQAVLREEADVTTIIARVLSYLARAYRQNEQWANSLLMLDLLKDLERYLKTRPRRH